MNFININMELKNSSTYKEINYVIKHNFNSDFMSK